MRAVLRTLALAVVSAVGVSAAGDNVGGRMQTPVNADAAAFEEFSKRVSDYVALHKKVSGTLPNVPDKATPKQIDDHQRALGKLMVAARPGAKRGDVFGPALPALIRRVLAPIFKGTEGAKVRAAIIDEPHPVIPAVNARYPDDVPLSTMPPDVLRVLPKLPEGLEFRFVGRHLILLDVRSHLIVDVIDNAMPA